MTESLVLMTAISITKAHNDKPHLSFSTNICHVDYVGGRGREKMLMISGYFRPGSGPEGANGKGGGASVFVCFVWRKKFGKIFFKIEAHD